MVLKGSSGFLCTINGTGKVLRPYYTSATKPTGNLACLLSKTRNSIFTLHLQLKSCTATNYMWRMWSHGVVKTRIYLALTPQFSSGSKPRNFSRAGLADKVLLLLRMWAMMKGVGKIGTGSDQQLQGVSWEYNVEYLWWGTNICFACGRICPRVPLLYGKENGQALIILQ